MPIVNEEMSDSATWKVVIAGSDEGICGAIRHEVGGYRFYDKGVSCVVACCVGDIVQLLKAHPDVALVLADVALEGEDSDGLCVVRHIREDLNNPDVRIVLCTEQRGRFPDEDAFIRYDIHDCRMVEELRGRGLFAVVAASLRSYRDRVMLRECHQRSRALGALAQEKELLLAEIHHRVKNNLQIISSLLFLQGKYVKDECVSEQLKESRYRVKSMALVHELLYQSNDLASVDFAQYIKILTSDLLYSYGVSTETVGVHINADHLLLGIDTAIPCGLIISELLTNAIKYAFAEDTTGMITIDFHLAPDNNYVLTISDNGRGLPGDIKIRNSKSFGLKLVHDLTMQQDGTIAVDNSAGTAYRITFPRKD
ncbi:sensor histidine kinase [Candidatus Magnetobacterium casense]|uniref:histidine kinase n=1 Tax=Candidatus Magnetobacterium casense TaxID=1455061 RepID=A0ABS6S2R1_9BACT|nr:histidine kinase dimerization/phosphoacceptor domain -containing protein [Candidatus Magnetobacterium casensis]MBV6343142.1 hypothetical protein [Candidatus Magnetobacterium casensis]